MAKGSLDGWPVGLAVPGQPVGGVADRAAATGGWPQVG